MPELRSEQQRTSAGSTAGLLIPVSEAVQAGRGMVVLLTGAPGSGKSTTLDRLLSGLNSRVGRLSRVTGDELSRRRPFGLVANLVGLTAEYPPSPDVADRILASVEVLCAAGAVVLSADDVHHADGDSLRLIGQLVDATHDLPLILLMARRPLPVRDALVALAARPDVLGVDLVGLDSADVAALVASRFGSPPGPRLRHALEVAEGNPFHLQAMLTNFHRAGRLDLGSLHTELIGAEGSQNLTQESVYDSVRAHLALLDPSDRDLLQILAVWGRPADVADLAKVGGLTPAALLRSVQSAVSTRVVCWSVGDQLAFSHDLYRDVLYADLAPGLRRVLHAACAAHLSTTGGIGTEITQHSGDAASHGVDADAALRIAATELQFAPDQAADLLAQVRTTRGSREADAVAIARAGALAAAGRMGDTERVAREGIAATHDPAARNTLTRLLLHGMVSAADTRGALAVIDAALDRPVDEAYQHALVHLRRWVTVLTGTAPVGIRPEPVGLRSGAALVPTAVELFLRARCESALATVVEAQEARSAKGSPGWGDGVTAPVWPGLFALYARGPEAAAMYSRAARSDEQQAGRGWLFPYHLNVAGMIDQFAGRWDDALTVYGTGLEAAAATGTGWLSRGTGGLLQIQVQRGALDIAAAGLARWKSGHYYNEHGLPFPEQAEILLGEARGESHSVRELAYRTWATALDGGRLIWGLLAGPDIARIALQCGDESLLERVRSDICAIATDEVPALAAAVELVCGIAGRDAARAAAAALGHRNAGCAAGEIYSWEEAAVAAAADGRKEESRSYAVRALNLAQTLGAKTVERRLAARLRTYDVRLGVTGTRGRPVSGFASLTSTELQVAEKVGQGLTSPQIAAQLYVSPRTIQTHISHILRKLDLRSRVELATALTRYGGDRTDP